LSPPARLYQRLLAMDQQEATELAGKFLEEHSLQELYDEMVLPALVMAEQDCQSGALDEDKHRAILQNIRFLVDEMAGHNEELKRKREEKGSCHPGGDTAERRTPGLISGEIAVLCIPARGEADEIAAVMLKQLLNEKGAAARTFSASSLAAEKMDLIRQEKAGVACVSAVPPLGIFPAHHLCKRLAAEFPELRLVAGVWHAKSVVQDFLRRVPAISPDHVATSFREAVERILPLASTAGTRTNQPLAASNSKET